MRDGTQAHLILRDQPHLLDLTQGRAEGLFVAHLVPGDQLLDPLIVDQVEAKALGFVVFPLPTPSPSPALLALRTGPYTLC